MRRRIVAMSAIATATVVAAGVPCASFAGVSNADKSSPRVVAAVADPKGDVVAKTGKLNDVSNGNSKQPFKPGHGTKATPTAADKAIDLHKVTYTVVRTGAKPFLKVVYQVKGPFSRSSKTHQTATSYTWSGSFDGAITYFAKGYDVVVENEAKKVHAEFDSKSGATQKCAGLTGTMKSGSRTATVSLPLSCLAAAGVKASRLSSETMHATIDMSGTEDGPSTNSVTIATDNSRKSSALPLTAYKK